MPAQLRATCAAIAMAVAPPFRITTVAIALLIALGGCRDAPVPPPAAIADPADPRAPVPRVGYRSTTGAYTSRRPVSPAPWGEGNAPVAPPPKPEQREHSH